MGGGQDFHDRVVMITGAASGFGALAARAFAARGARLALSDLDGAAIALDGLPADTLTGSVDVCDESQIETHIAALQARFGRLDVAVNNAGMSHPMKPLHKITGAEFDRVMAVNARGVFLGMKHQIPVMLASGDTGAIVNLASAAGILGAGRLAAYAAAKHAVVGLTRAAADELAPKGLRVNAVCPSFARTPLFETLADELGARHGLDRAASHAHIAARVPMRRVAAPEEVVQAILWSASPANSFMTGQAIAIDGGLSAI